ncbi:MAG TPA: MlaD family protein [Solirubrobacterales bacterium]|nr:MlaD family protein [Solirubrobacterales bacterium]
MRGRTTSLASNPVMVGAITVLIIVLAVFLAYNANQGLPFVPTYNVTVQVPGADELVPGNEVRIGGVRVGAIQSIEPVAHNDGSSTARLDLKLDSSAKPIPKDSTVAVRAQSSLGLKYLEIVKGDSSEGYPEGSELPLSAAHPEPVDLDEVLNTFDEPTQVAIQRNLVEFGDALAARGPALNAAIGQLAPLVRRLQPVARILSAPSTRLARFVTALRAAAAEVAPVAELQARMFVSLDTTFGGLANVARPFIQETISKAPVTEDTAIATLPTIRPFLSDSAALFADLRPGVRALRQTAPTIADSLVVGIPALRASPELNAELDPTAEALLDLADDAGARRGIDQLTEFNSILAPTLQFITPAQSVCNYVTLLARNVSSLLGLGDGIGTWQRFIVFDIPKGPNSEGSPASGPANGPDTPNYLHVNPYPNTASPGQERECEAGNEPYLAGQQVIGNVPGNQGTQTEDQPVEKKKKGKGKGKGG